ncbi:MAG TPA: tripartite tricarboxylate transporter substrate binding protein [Burkholderiales bacterium]|nr:tripartite tricarboxylate transporter substrate binding protein [Burkholderiales bacterium]
MFRSFSCAALLAISAALAQAQAQNYPVKPVKIISPYSPGGLGDLLPRAVAAGLTDSLGQQVIVENRPGASQIIGMQAAARSPADGYTLVLGSATSLAINPGLNKNLPYDPVKDFAPVALCVTTPLYLVVHPSVPARSVRDLLALAKAQPGTLTFASGGNGSSNHLAGELFKSLARVDLLHVPYKGAGPAMIDVMAGHVAMMFGAAGLAEAKAGKVRVLGVTGAKRSATAPELPTLSESGVPGYEATIWFGLLAPAGTPAPLVSRLSQEIGKALAQPRVREQFTTLDITPTTPEGFAALIRREIPKWRKVIDGAKIPAE